MIFSPWVMVAIAGVLEIVWAISLKYSDGFTRLVPSVITIAGAFASFWFLVKGMQAQPMPSGSASGRWAWRSWASSGSARGQARCVWPGSA